MTPSCLLRAILGGLVTLGVPVAVHAGVLDQEHVDRGATNLGEVSSTFSRAQTFTVGITGLLDRVDVQIGQDLGSATSPDAPLVVEIRRTEGGTPVSLPSGVLASVLVQPEQVPGSVFSELVAVELGAQSLPVTQGDVLAIAMRSQTAPARPYHWAFDENERYRPGDFYTRSAFSNDVFIRLSDADPSNPDHLDAGFRTYVNIVPEPGAIVSVLVASCFNLLRRRHVNSPPGRA
jgi:hypothetical protein